MNSTIKTTDFATKPILGMDFDGVIHSYTTRWTDAKTISDPPVPGAMEFLFDASKIFQIAIFSSRSSQDGGTAAMQKYIATHMREYMYQVEAQMTLHDAETWSYDFVYHNLMWLKEKPPAHMTIDDRAMTFRGEWPDPAELLNFKPWNKVRPIQNVIALDQLGDDGHAWAAAFCKTAKKLGHFDLDEGWLIGWFVNAIEISSITRRGKSGIEKRLQQLEECVKTASSTGNADANDYMYGMANGLILGLATIKGEDPAYLDYRGRNLGFTKVKDRHPPAHRKYIVKRNGFTHTCTPCYGMHHPWWVQATMMWPDSGVGGVGPEVEPVPMLDDDEWMEITK